EADVGDRVGRDGDPREHVARTRPRRVDGDVRQAVPLEEGEGVGTLVLLDPRPVTKLDERHERVEQRRDRGELLERLARLDEAGRVLQEDAAKLPRPLEWGERVAKLGERPLPVAPAVPGHLRARLRVEDEALGGALGPLRGRLRRGQVVEGRVDLDRVEALRVVGEPLRRRGNAPRVPALDQALVRPGARSDPDHAIENRSRGRDESSPPRSSLWRWTRGRSASSTRAWAA